MLTSALYETESCVRIDTNAIRLSPNLQRDRVHLNALIADPLPLRNALLGLRDCILSDQYTSLDEIRNRQMDPVITVTGAKLFFEAFSTDESSYARVVIGNQALREQENRKTGCTNIDFSEKLRFGLQEMRSRRTAFLQIEREGVGLQTAGRSIKEKKIEMPDSWIYGFLQVQSALRLPGVVLELDPIDLRNLLIYLKRRRESVSPRSLRFRLSNSPSVLIEPWNDVIELRYSRAEVDCEVQLWGRRRLLILEKLLPHMQKARVLLQGTGMPSFWDCDLGAGVSFLLGLSAWSSRDWTHSESFHLFDAPVEVTAFDFDLALSYVNQRAYSTRDDFIRDLRLTNESANAVLNLLCLQGRVLYEPQTAGYYARNLFPENPPDPPSVSKREKEAAVLVHNVQIDSRESPADGLLRVAGEVTGRSGSRYRVICVLDSGRIVSAFCSCPFFWRFHLTRGPCKHLLALRLTQMT